MLPNDALVLSHISHFIKDLSLQSFDSSAGKIFHYVLELSHIRSAGALCQKRSQAVCVQKASEVAQNRLVSFPSSQVRQGA